MDVILAVLGMVLVVVFGITVLAFPHLLEGVVHAYLAPTVGALAFVPFGRRDVGGAGATRQVADGYRGTRTVEAPGLEEGRWLRVLPDPRRSVRITIPDPRTAYVTVLARRRFPVSSIERGVATLRIQVVDVGDGRRLVARLIPGNLALPLSIPVYAALASGGSYVLLTIVGSLPTAAAVLVVWQIGWWFFHVQQLREARDYAMSFLEQKLAEASAEVEPSEVRD